MFDFLVGILRGVDPFKKMRLVRTIHLINFHAESSVVRLKTCFSVVEMRSENVAFVSENEGSDLGIPWPDRPPSSDCPVGWHADDAPRRHRGSRPVLAQNQGVRVAIPAGAFMPPETRPKAFL